MKRLFTLAFCLCACVILAFAATDPNPTMKIGLFFDSSALPSANLQNAVGAGYRLGQFDENRVFTPLFTINDQKISMLKDVNFYYADGTFYESGAPSGSKRIGAYNLQLQTTYATATEASSMADSLKLRGNIAFPAYQNGGFVVRVGSYADFAAATAAGQSANLGQATLVAGAEPQTVTVTDTTTGDILFEYGGNLGVLPVGTNTKTWFKGYQYYGSFQYIRSGGNLTVVNVVKMQDYIKGVIPYEMSASWPLEALRAQAMCARTYAMSSRRHKDFDLCNTTDCQVYRGTNSASETTDRAVDSTLGMYILYEGKPISAVYHSSDGGATENSENVWTGVTPYLRGVKDPYEDLDAATHGRWSYEYTGEEIAALLRAKGKTPGKIVDVRTTYTEMGNMLCMTFVDENGEEYSYSKEPARTFFAKDAQKRYVYSLRFTITKKGSAGTGAVVPSTGGTLFVNGPSVSIQLSDDTAIIGAGGTRTLSNGDSVTVRSANGTRNYSVGGTTTTPNVPSTSGDVVFLINGTGWGHK